MHAHRLGRDREQNVDGRTTAQDEARADRPQAGIKCLQAVMEPPPACATMLPVAGGGVIEHENGEHGPAIFSRCHEGGIVGDTQILPEPHDHGIGHGMRLSVWRSEIGRWTGKPASRAATQGDEWSTATNLDRSMFDQGIPIRCPHVLNEPAGDLDHPRCPPDQCPWKVVLG